MSDDDEEIRLRDQLAMAALPALIARFTDRNKDEIWMEKGKPNLASKSCAKAISILAYQIADEMRKTRLQSFT